MTFSETYANTFRKMCVARPAKCCSFLGSRNALKNDICDRASGGLDISRKGVHLAVLDSSMKAALQVRVQKNKTQPARRIRMKCNQLCGQLQSGSQPEVYLYENTRFSDQLQFHFGTSTKRP